MSDMKPYVYVSPKKRDPREMTRDELIALVELLKGDVKAAESAYERMKRRFEELRRDHETHAEYWNRRSDRALQAENRPPVL